MKTETTDYAVAIPHLGALILTHTWNGAIKGLKDFPPEDAALSRRSCSWRFRIMVGLGVLMVGVGLVGLCGCAGAGGSTSTRWLHARRGRDGRRRASSPCWPAGSPPRSGRQPFTVYGLLRTADSVSPIDAPGVGASLAGLRGRLLHRVRRRRLLYMLRLMRQAPQRRRAGPPKGVPVRSAGITPAPSLDEAAPRHPARRSEVADDAMARPAARSGLA